MDQNERIILQKDVVFMGDIVEIHHRLWHHLSPEMIFVKNLPEALIKEFQNLSYEPTTDFEEYGTIIKLLDKHNYSKVNEEHLPEKVKTIEYYRKEKNYVHH